MATVNTAACFGSSTIFSTEKQKCSQGAMAEKESPDSSSPSVGQDLIKGKDQGKAGEISETSHLSLGGPPS